ncbi:unnamed protein product [Adineta steineri]|uniref:Replication-associated protein n=1 Tax=Adineta steineri TaxID=433720 RepID=A0A819KFR7_9BILA|nr:unnamed protein product [Adineta steineri]
MDEKSKQTTISKDCSQASAPGSLNITRAELDEIDKRRAQMCDTEVTLTTPITSSQHPYPPAQQTGTIKAHDLPYAEYGHMDRETIAQECRFNLNQFPDQPSPPRYHAKSWAIIAFTNLAQEEVMASIQEKFGINQIQYLCISEETNKSNGEKNLYIQLIFKTRIDRRVPFIDDLTDTQCNYFAAKNDLAWNEYLKQGGHWIEYGEFRSMARRGSQQQWPSSTPSSTPASTATITSSASARLPTQPSRVASAAATTRINQQQLVVPSRATTTTNATTVRPLTVRALAEQRREHDNEIAREALALAEKSVDKAMDFLQLKKPNKFLEHSRWYLDTFKYVNLRAQQLADRSGTIDKEYTWDESFPECTPRLRAAVEDWMRTEFNRKKRARCLILIGRTGIGKTSFAMSLPGQFNYFQGRWNLDSWSDYARYSIYDDVPWAKFGERGFPDMKGLLTQNGKMNASCKYRSVIQINVQQPAIVLLNHDDAGSLVNDPRAPTEQGDSEFWEERAVTYIIGDDEHFYPRSNRSQHNSPAASQMNMD